MNHGRLDSRVKLELIYGVHAGRGLSEKGG